MKRLILLMSATMTLGAISSVLTTPIAAEEVEQNTTIDNVAMQDYRALKEQLVFATDVTEGSKSDEIPVSDLHFDDEFHFEKSNQKLVSYFYDDAKVEIMLYFVDNNLIYISWVNYQATEGVFGEGFTGYGNNLTATLSLKNDDASRFVIKTPSIETDYDYQTQIHQSPGLMLDTLLEEAKEKVKRLIDVTDLPEVSSNESAKKDKKDDDINYKEFVDNPAWLTKETKYQPNDLSEAYDSFKASGATNLEEADETTANSQLYYANAKDNFVKLEMTSGDVSLVTLGNYTPDVYKAFPDNIDTKRTYTVKELSDLIGPITIKQYNQQDKTERYAWIRLDGDTQKILIALPDSQKADNYMIQFEETEEDAS